MSRRAALAVVIVAACDGSSAAPDGPSTDAPTVDAAIDAMPDATPDGPPANIDITVLSGAPDGHPDSTAVVMFYDAGGTTLSYVTTDAAGMAAGYVPDGGSVTVWQLRIDGNTRVVELTTIRPVHPGDHLFAGQETEPPVRGGTMDAMTASYTPPAGSTYSQLITPCASGSGTPAQFFLDLWPTCAGATFSLAAIADDAAGNRSFLYNTGFAHVPDGTVALTGAFAPMTAATVTFANVPDNLSVVFARWFTMLDAYPWLIDQKNISIPPPGTNVVQPIHPPATGAGTLVYAGATRGITIIEDFAVYADTPIDATTIDFAALPVPRPESPPMQTATGVSWTPVGTGTPDERIVTWSGTWTEGTTQHQVEWKMIEDPTAAPSSALPTLPFQFEQDDPHTVDPITIALGGAIVVYVDYDNLAGWDDARPYGPWLEWTQRAFLGVAHRAHLTRGP